MHQKVQFSRFFLNSEFHGQEAAGCHGYWIGVAISPSTVLAGELNTPILGPRPCSKKRYFNLTSQFLDRVD